MGTIDDVEYLVVEEGVCIWKSRSTGGGGGERVKVQGKPSMISESSAALIELVSTYEKLLTSE